MISSGEEVPKSVLLSSTERFYLNQLESVFNSNTSDVTLKTYHSDADFMQDGTMTVMGIRKRWNNFSPEFKEIASQYFLSKPAPENNQSLQKTLMRNAKSVRVAHLLPNWVETEHFNIEWGNNLYKGDSGVDSVKIVSCSAAFNSGAACSRIPDFVDKWADYLEEVWDYEIGQLGNIKPVGTDFYLYDVYIANTKDNINGNADDLTPSLGYKYLGLTITDCDKDYSKICKDNNSSEPYSYIILNNSYADDQTMKITAAHEFYHAIQFSYPTIDKWWSSPDNHWWLEATATWMEEVVYDEINLYYPRVRSWLRSPELSLKNAGTSYSGHEYGDVIFILYLTDVFLKNRDFVRDVWESEESGIDALNLVLKTEKYGNSDFESAFKGFIALNAVADIGHANGGYEEGKQYGRAEVTGKHEVYPATVSVSSDSAPHELGSNYIHFLPPGNADNSLTIEFDGTDRINWAALLVKVRSDGKGFEVENMYIDPLLKTGCHSVNGFGSIFSEVFLVASVLIEPGLADTAPYRYKADIGGDCSSVSDLQFPALMSETESRDNGRSDKRCFIATAAFGSSHSPYVRILREFRDRYLMNSDYGRLFISTYYSVSPSAAYYLEKHPASAVIVRFALFPVIGIAFFCLKTSLLTKIVLTVILLSAYKLLSISARHNK